jgi:hypothetical protein
MARVSYKLGSSLYFILFAIGLVSVRGFSVIAHASIMKAIPVAGKAQKPARNTIRDEKNKCRYVNNLFPVTTTTCSVKPELIYHNLYDDAYRVELWEYQQQNCLPYRHFHVSENYKPASRKFNFIDVKFILIFILILVICNCALGESNEYTNFR